MAKDANGPALEPAVVFDPNAIRDIIYSAASALSAQQSLQTVWEQDDSMSSRFVQWVDDHNPVSQLAKGLAHGDWSGLTLRNTFRANPLIAAFADRDPSRPSSFSGAVAVKIDTAQRARLFQQFCIDFYKTFEQRAASKPAEAMAYLKTLVEMTKKALLAVSEQFKLARKVNSDVSIYLNDALDRAYRISVTAGVAFLIVGCLPIAAEGAAALVAEKAFTGAVMASAGSTGMVTLKVAGVGLVYGTLNSLAFDPQSAKRAKVAGVPLDASAKAGGVNSASTGAQALLEKQRMAELNSRLAKARTEAARANVRNSVRNAMRDALSGNAPNMPHEVPRFPPGGMTEPQRNVLQSRVNDIERQVANKYRFVSKTGTVFFVGVGLYLMRNDIKTAWNGLTTGTDRTR